MAAHDVVAGGVPSAVGAEVSGGRAAERLHKCAEPTDEGVHGIDVMAARGPSGAPPGVQREVRNALILPDPPVGGMAVRAEHRVRCHDGQQRARDSRLARIRDGFKYPASGAACCRKELLLPRPPAARWRCRHRAPPQVVPPSRQRPFRDALFSRQLSKGHVVRRQHLRDH